MKNKRLSIFKIQPTVLYGKNEIELKKMLALIDTPLVEEKEEQVYPRNTMVRSIGLATNTIDQSARVCLHVFF